jgi:hypothetical protein
VLDKFITRAWGDGTDFIGTDLFRPTTGKAMRTGFGDLICEFSNLYAQTSKASVLTNATHAALSHFASLVDLSGRKYDWIENRPLHTQYVNQSTDNESLCEVSGMKLLHCYPDYEYVQLDKSKFDTTDIPEGHYGTYQSKGISGKCSYDRPHIQKYIDKVKRDLDIPFVDVANLQHLGLAKVAYIIDNAMVHVGIDSGMTHFAHTIKLKDDVIIIVPEDRITGVSYRWLNHGFRVELV